MAQATYGRRFIFWGVRGEREGTPQPTNIDETIFFENRARKVYCGPRMGNVILRPDKSVEIDGMQLVKLQEYEREKHLVPASVETLPDGRYLLSTRRAKKTGK